MSTPFAAGRLLAAAVAALATGAFVPSGAAAAPAAPHSTPLSLAVPQDAARITGTVTDSSTGQPLGNVQVSIVGTRLGGLTRDDGTFAIANVPAGTYTVEARRVGFAPSRRNGVVVTAGALVTVDIRLTAAVLRLQEVVTIGVTDPTSGTRTPFTVAKIGAEEVPVPATNAVETLAGRVAGANIQTNGQPGSGLDVQLRTPASITGSNSPLIVVDGVILATDLNRSTSDLNSLDIESIEVVKGAAAASLYGSRAANGVIAIRTKRGRELAEGRTRVTLRSEYGSNSLQQPIAFAQDSRFLVANGTYVDTLGNPVERGDRVAGRFQDQRFAGATFDQIDRFFDAGQFGQTSLTISRNQGTTNFLVALSNQNSDGVIANNGGYQRNDVRLNLDHRLRDNLTIGTSAYYARATRDELNNDLFFDLVNQAPDIDLTERDPETGELVFQPDQFGTRPNPLYTLGTEGETTRRTRALGSLESRYAPLGWLSFDANISFDQSVRSYEYFLDRGFRSADQTYDLLGGLQSATGRTSALNAASSMNLLGRTGALTLRGSLRGQIERERADREGFIGNDLLVPGVLSPSNVRFRLPPGDVLDGDPYSEIRTNSYIATTGAEYGGRYIADALVRRDGSSLFGADQRWQTFYRGSFAWRAAAEEWWPFKQALTEFKPRISRGTAGGRPDYDAQYETFNISDQGVLEKATLGNPDLRPERATETEAGLDMIFYNRVSLQTSYSRTKVTDQLLLVPQPAAAGFPFQWQNAGTVRGNTFEMTLEAQVVERQNFGWRAGLVADRTRHSITEYDLPCAPTTTSAGLFFRCAGERLGSMYGAVHVTDRSQLTGVSEAGRAQFQRNDDGYLVPVGPDGSWRDARWGETVTIDGQNYAWGLPIVATDEAGIPVYTRIGDANPTFRWGLSNNVRWKGFNFFALVDAQVGGDIYNRTEQRMYQYYLSRDVDQAGRDDAVKKPLQYFDRLYNGNNITGHFVEPGGYLKLRELSARYTFGSRLLAPLARTGVRGLTVGIIGRNLLTFTDYSGYDPEVGSVNARIDDFIYPRFRTVTGTVEVEF